MIQTRYIGQTIETNMIYRNMLSQRLEKTRGCIINIRCCNRSASFTYYCNVTIVTYIYFLFYYRMANTNKLLEAVQPKNSLVVNSVTIEDDAIIIRFTSDGDERKKTMPLTDKGMKIKDWLADIFANENFDPNSIWNLVKDWGRLAGCCVDLAKKAKEKQAIVDDMFAKLGLGNPIDTL